MNILGIDYGEKKIGLAIAKGSLAEPLCMIRYKDIKILRKRIEEIAERENIKKVVVGISEGKMGEESRKFSLSLSQTLKVPVETWDETLSTYEAQRLAKEAKMTRKKRKTLEDAFAAAVMLQSYLDSHV